MDIELITYYFEWFLFYFELILKTVGFIMVFKMLNNYYYKKEEPKIIYLLIALLFII